MNECINYATTFVYIGDCVSVLLNIVILLFSYSSGISCINNTGGARYPHLLRWG